MSEKKVSLGTVMCLIIIFILIMCLAGMWYYYNHINVVNNDIKNNGIELNNNDLNDENIVQNDTKNEDEDKVEQELDEKIAGFIIENYLDLQGRKEGSYVSLLEELKIVDEVNIDLEETITISDGRKLCKTNIKYNEFKDALLTYMSSKIFEEFIDNSFVENNGYLYTEPAGASGYSFDVYNVKLKEKTDKYLVYEVKAECLGPGDLPEYYDIESTIVKENGKYVLDSYKYIQSN